MSPIAMAGNADAGSSARRYRRHRLESTLLYPLIAKYYPAFKERMLGEGRASPGYVQREFDDYLKCGRLEHGFLRVRCEDYHSERLVALSWPFLCIPAPTALVNPFTSPRRGFCPSGGARRMVDDCMDAGGRAKQKPEPKVPHCWWMRSCLGDRCAN